MKKLMVSLMIAVVFFIGFSSIGFTATKYDYLLKDPGFQKLTNFYEKTTRELPFVKDYLNHYVNMNDINQILKNGDLDREKSKFISENKTRFLNFLQSAISASLGNSGSLNGVKDSEWIYVTEVINTHTSGRSITNKRTRPEEAAMEKMLFEGHPLYASWLHFEKQKPQIIVDMINKVLISKK